MPSTCLLSTSWSLCVYLVFHVASVVVWLELPLERDVPLAKKLKKPPCPTLTANHTLHRFHPLLHLFPFPGAYPSPPPPFTHSRLEPPPSPPPCPVLLKSMRVPAGLSDEAWSARPPPPRPPTPQVPKSEPPPTKGMFRKAKHGRARHLAFTCSGRSSVQHEHENIV